jgi:ElaB/YqjD/DUF883 family membrane-anchored ribosome-binding protein
MLASAQDQVSAQTGAVKEAFASAKDAVTSTAGQVADTARSAADSVSAEATRLRQQVQATAGQVSGSVEGAMSQARSKGEEVRDNSRNAVVDFIDQNPILVAGIGAAVGAAIAASFPSSDAENRLFARPREALKSKSNELLADGVKKAKDMTASVVGEVTEAAAREGLDADGLKKAVGDVMTGARTVVDRGLSSALEGVAPKGNEKTNQNPQSSF